MNFYMYRSICKDTDDALVETIPPINENLLAPTFTRQAPMMDNYMDHKAVD